MTKFYFLTFFIIQVTMAIIITIGITVMMKRSNFLIDIENRVSILEKRNQCYNLI